MSSEDARLLAQTSPASFAHVCSEGRWVPYEHLILLNDHLLRLVGGEFDRLIVTMPPRHGKSELISHWLPAWYLGAFPDRQVMLASYEARFAASWSRKARESLTEHGPWVFGVGVADEPRAADWWTVDGRDGVMVSAGVGGPLTGKGADLLIIDDPVKNSEEAASEVIREKHWEWWQSTASTRLQPQGRVVLVMTRWHEDDLAGRLIAQGGWRILNLPAHAELGDELNRREGEALCSELFDKKALERIRHQTGGYYWTAMYQQRPAPPEGFLFKRSDLRYWHIEQEPPVQGRGVLKRWYVLPDGDRARHIDTGYCTTFQTVDAAISEKETADYTCVATWQSTPEGDLILLRIARRHFEEQQIVEFLASENEAHGRCPMWIERFGAGRNPLAILARRGYPVMEIPAEAGTQTDKITRAFGAVALCERHQLFLPAAQPEWLGGYEDELASFPNAARDDQVDVTSYAARLLPRLGQQAKKPSSQQGPPMISQGILSEQF